MTKIKFTDGIHDISNDEYHSSEGISRSRLMLLDKSPYHYWYEMLSGQAEKKEATPAMIIGSAFHTLLLEPEKFQSEYAISPKIDRRTKQGKEDYDIFTQESIGKIVLTDDQYEKIRVMVEMSKKHDIVETLLENSKIEKSIFWTDKETGLQFKTRPDAWSNKMIVDLKTTEDSNGHSFKNSAIKYGYYLQAGMAFEAFETIGIELDMFVILAIEKTAPHVPSVFMMKEEAIQFGRKQFDSYKRKLKRCIDENNWPGYVVQELDIPGYATVDGEEE